MSKSKNYNADDADAIILGTGITALGVIRNLGRLGIRNIVIAHENNYCMYSKYCHQKLFIENIADSPGLLLQVLTTLTDSRPNKLFCLFPCTDYYVLALGEIKDRLPKNVELNQPELEALHCFIKKQKFYALLAQLNIPHPQTYDIQSAEDLPKLKNEIKFPVFLKPVESHEFQRYFGKKGFTVYEFQELQKCFELALSKNLKMMVQEIVSGGAEQHYFIDGYVDKSGEIRALFARRRIHMYPLDWGNSSSMVSVSLATVGPAIVDLKKLINQTNYKGIFNVEVKYDLRSGRFKFIELNPRPWWYNLFPTICGVKIIEMAYRDMSGLSITPHFEYTLNSSFVYWWLEMASLVEMVKLKRIDFFSLFKDIKFSLNTPIFAIDDLKPVLIRLIKNIH
jgi:predicted ATP-grasp superfamily ATP-dependent carboligase